MHACMYVCMHACTYVCMYVWAYACTRARRRSRRSQTRNGKQVDQLEAKQAKQQKQAASSDESLQQKLSEYMLQNQRILKENALRRARSPLSQSLPFSLSLLSLTLSMPSPTSIAY